MTSVLEHHRKLSRDLGVRSDLGGQYRTGLAQRIGLRPGHIVSTAEHIAPFNVADSASFLLPQMLLGSEGAPVIHLLGGALVPLDNRQYPRGFFAPGPTLPRHRANLFPQTLRKASPLLLPPVSFSPLDRLGLPDGVTAALEASAGAEHGNYAEQLCAAREVMTAAWRLQSPRQPVVKVWPLEAVAADLLISLLDVRAAAVMALLFDTRLRAELALRLSGVFCAWGENHGSFLFWGCRNHRLVRLFEHDQILQGDGIAVPIQPDTVAAALAAGTIRPGVYLSMMLVSYLPDVPVSGGPKQDHYLRKMIAVTNDLLGMARSPDLSTVGYMTIDATQLPVAGTQPAGTLQPYGIGLDIMMRGVARDVALNRLAALPVARLSGSRTRRRREHGSSPRAASCRTGRH